MRELSRQVLRHWQVHGPQQIAEHLAEIRDQGIAILLIEHEMELIETLCDDVVVMVAGKFLTRGPFQQVVSDRRVQESYLGLTRA